MSGGMMLAEIVKTSNTVASTRSRLAKSKALSDLLGSLALQEVPLAVSYLAGELPQRRVGVGWASFRDTTTPASAPSLTISDVDDVFRKLEAASGPGSVAARKTLLARLLSQATVEEQRFIGALVSGELRQGALAGIMADAVAVAANVSRQAVQRAAMLSGSLPKVAKAALEHRESGLSAFRLEVGRAIQPMLARSASSVNTAVGKTSPSSVELKLDGIRIQVHRSGDDVSIFTRTLEPITDRLPEVVEAVRSLPVASIILDGEAIALRPDGRPRPFQQTGSRVASRGDVEKLRQSVPITPFFFDLLHLDGHDLIDQRLSERVAQAEGVVPRHLWVPRVTTIDGSEASAFAQWASEAAHEGIVVKSLDSVYEAGRRGAGWIKVKPHHTLDLVVIGVECGHGRRKGWLSNLHLAAMDSETGDFVMLGKTFKGLTDEMLRWQTARLQAIQVSDNGWTVNVRPELVAEIAFDGIQTSSRYPGGMALRFARVVRYRTDKTPAEADTIQTVRQLYEERA